MRYRKNKKGQFELSISFLVKLVLGLAMFGIGLWLAFMIFDKGNDLVNPNENQCKDVRCDPNDPLCIPEASKQIGKDTTSYCVFVTNLLPGKKNFKLEMDPPILVGTNQQNNVFEIATTLDDDGEFELLKTGSQKINIMLYNKGVEEGKTYSTDVKILWYDDVSRTWKEYQLQKIYVTT